jgi:hypothetical protein
MMSASCPFRVFVSSTFSDLVEERNALQRQVWPELAKLCEKAGFRFQAIDLRWGISDDAGLDQQTSRICLQELKRCQATTPRPNFVVLLGNCYCQRPLPAEIEASEFEAIEKKAAELNLPHRTLLPGWYRRDENALPPVYYLRRRLQEGDVDYTQFDVWTTLVETPPRELLATCASAIPPLKGIESSTNAPSPSEKSSLARWTRQLPTRRNTSSLISAKSNVRSCRFGGRIRGPRTPQVRGFRRRDAL